MGRFDRPVNFVSRTSNKTLVLGGFFAIGLLVGVLLFADFLVFKATQDTVTITVKDKDWQQSCSGTGNDRSCDSYYVVFTDKGVYKNEDSLWAFKFNSSDLQGNLDRGKTYDCKVTGFRVPIISSYKNLLSCKEAS